VKIIEFSPAAHGSAEGASAKIEGEDQTAFLYAALDGGTGCLEAAIPGMR